MDEGFKVRAEVVKVRRHCPLGHKVGAAWEIGETTPKGFASMLFSPSRRAGARSTPVDGVHGKKTPTRRSLLAPIMAKLCLN